MLSPIAAGGLAIAMAGAIAVHKEAVIFPLALSALAIAAAVLGFLEFV